MDELPPEMLARARRSVTAWLRPDEMNRFRRESARREREHATTDRMVSEIVHLQESATACLQRGRLTLIKGGKEKAASDLNPQNAA